MPMTATQAAGTMIQRYDLEGAADILLREGLVLLPTDTLWCIACLADDPVALERLRRIKRPSTYEPYEILFSSLDDMKVFTPRLHPRLETLLMYHQRPLTVLTEGGKQLRRPALLADGQIAARLAGTAYCRQLLRLIGRPLATVAAYYSGSPFPDHFGRVRSDIIGAVDYVSRYRPKERALGRPSVMVTLNDLEELEFVRE
ncbi:MAG: Sua5/YciO/YrdC/YwlC family protein [Bacteroidota bacterium]